MIGEPRWLACAEKNPPRMAAPHVTRQSAGVPGMALQGQNRNQLTSTGASVQRRRTVMCRNGMRLIISSLRIIGEQATDRQG